MSALPAYNESVNSSSSSISEKQSPSSPAGPQHPSETPLLDAHFAQPNIRQHLLTLSSAIGSLGQEDRSAKPAIEEISRALMGYKQDWKAAQKNGSLSKEDKKAMKREGRALMKNLKREFRK